MPVCFNRKEVKDHGEGGSLIGATPNGRVLIIDDVLSSGLAITEACDYLAPFDVDIAGALVTLNRQEKGQDSDQMAADELREKGTEIFQIISLDDLINAESLIDKTNLIKDAGVSRNIPRSIMFTGIVQGTGTIIDINKNNSVLNLNIKVPQPIAKKLTIGDSLLLMVYV